MTLTAKETTVAGTSLLSTAVTALFAIANGGRLTSQFADAVFEGDREAARLWAGLGFLVSGLVLAGAAVFGPFNGTTGFLTLSLGMASLGLAIIAVVQGGR